MKLLVTAATLTGLLTLTGCFDMPSVYPLYTAQTLVSEPGLPGTWVSKDGKEQLIIKADGDRTYHLTHVEDKGEASVWRVRLVNIDGVLVADMMMAKDDESIRAHHFLALTLTPGALQVHFIDSSELRENAVKEGLAYFTEDKKTVLTAPTAALSAFLKKHLAGEIRRDADLQFSRVL